MVRNKKRKEKLVKKLKAFKRASKSLNEITSTFKRNCSPRPIGKGLSKHDRIAKNGFFYKKSDHKMSCLRADYKNFVGQDAKNGLNFSILKMKRAYKLVGLKQPYRHNNLDFLD